MFGWAVFLTLGMLFAFYLWSGQTVQADQRQAVAVEPPTLTPTMTPTLPPSPTPTPDYRLELVTECVAFGYPLLDSSYLQGQYLPGSRLTVLGQFPKGAEDLESAEGEELLIWYQIDTKSWLLASCFNQDGVNLPAVSPGLIPPTSTSLPPTFTPVPTSTPIPTHTPIPTNTPAPTQTPFSYLPQPKSIPAVTEPTITPTPSPTPQFLKLVQPMPEGAVPDWCIKLHGSGIEWVQLYDKRYNTQGDLDDLLGSDNNDGFIYLGPQTAVLNVAVVVRSTQQGIPVEKLVIFHQCGVWGKE